MTFLWTLITCLVIALMQYFSVRLYVKWNKDLFWALYGDIVFKELSKDIERRDNYE